MPDGAFVTVVSGLPRSGTSMMMQMLAAGGMPVLTDRIRAADEDNPRGYFELDAVKRTRQDPSWLQQAPGKAVKVIHLLLPELPFEYTYRVIVMRRPLTEVIASQREMLRRSGRAGAAIPDERLAKVYRAQLAQTDKWMARQRSLRALAVEYHNCLLRPAAVAANVNGFLGGALDEPAMAAAIDPALYHQRSR